MNYLTTVSTILEAVNLPVFKSDDYSFLVANKDKLAKFQENTFKWRTHNQKLSILNDGYHPTTHGKFHQAMLEVSGQFEQTLYLAKEFEMKKIQVEEWIYLADKYEGDPDKLFEAKRVKVDLDFAQYELNNMKTQMVYRMKEVKDWVEIIESLQTQLAAEGMTGQEIFDKEAGEEIYSFLRHLQRLHGIKSSTDSASTHNLLSLARFAVQRASDLGKLEEWIAKYCQPVHLEALNYLGVVDERGSLIRAAGQNSGAGNSDSPRPVNPQLEVEHG